MSASRIFCPSCGAENKAQDRFCMSCGGRLPDLQPPAPPPVAPEAVYEAPTKGSNLPLLVTVGAVFVLLILVVVEAAVIVMSPGAVEETGATLSVLEGNVFVQDGGEGNWMEVADDFVVTAGDRIRVGGGSQALLTFVEDTTTELRAFTELTVSHLHVADGQPVDINLDLAMGELWNVIGDLPSGSLHQVTTVAATVLAGGTQYGVAADKGGNTWLTGYEGVANVTGGGQTVELLAGETLLVEPGSPPEYYQEAVVALEEEEEEEPEISVACNLESIDLWSFGNRPLAEEYAEPVETPSHTPTSTPTATREPTSTPTATSTARPTATTPACPPDCPTFRINVPSGGPPYGLFGIEWDVLGGSVPAGFSYVLEYSQDQSSWGRTPILTWKDSQGHGQLWEAGGHVNAEIHGPGPGTWYWRVCIVRSETGPSCCCGPSHTIIHERDGEPEEEEPYYDD